MSNRPAREETLQRRRLKDEAGFIAARKYRGSWIVLYHAEAQGIDVDGAPYAVVCQQHGTVQREINRKLACATTLHFPEFCERCMTADDFIAEVQRMPEKPSAPSMDPADLERVEQLRVSVEAMLGAGRSVDDIDVLVRLIAVQYRPKKKGKVS